MYDALHADKLQPLYMNGMAQPIFPYTTGEVTEGYSTTRATSSATASMSRPTTTPTTTQARPRQGARADPARSDGGNYKAATIYEARPYITGCNESMNR